MDIKFLRDSYLYKFLASKYHQCMCNIDPRIEMARAYKVGFGRKPNFNNPKDLIEKIFWLQLNTDTTLWTKCADKLKMRDYVVACGFEANLPKLLGHWSSVDEMSFEGFPPNFVLKTNNGCETCIIVRNGECDLNHVKKKFMDWLSLPYGYSGGQMHYTRITPCIIAEELLEQSENAKDISPKSLIDYKLWCFKGKPEAFFVAFNRSHSGLNVALYDLNWKPMPQFVVGGSHYRFDPTISIPKPDSLEEIIRMASVLSEPFPEVRCDFYDINGKPYIGELTFTTGFPYFTQDYYNYLGSKIELPDKDH